ncbi:hypothetical protein ED733_002562 [Metarhizium rileyi]|uniref:Protein kinase-like domain protein n=1 Tax=Metarhizium rileyi (strain RCEF 4871) TaxID=1649241 RepID=A0A5C6G596_METRR|nr:hypothetical protein ED733_002562 [Metarhizium rileyi]
MSKRIIEELKRQIQEANARIEEINARAEESKAREEEEWHRNQKTTLAEYLHNCHFDLYQKLRLAQDSNSSTDLATSRQDQFDKIVGICGQQRLFNQEGTTRDNGTIFERSEARSEMDIFHFETIAVEYRTWDILDAIWSNERSCQEYQSRNLRFGSGPRNFNNLGKDSGAQDKRERVRQEPNGSGTRTGLDGIESLAFIHIYITAHNFAVQHLEAALAKETLFMDVHERTQTDGYSTDSTMEVEKREEARVARALIRVFNYMLLHGVRYGYVTTGKSRVFLYYDEEEPLVLRWHLCLPEKVVAQTRSAAVEASQLSLTTLAQLASFCLVSLSSPALTGRWLGMAVDRAGRVLKKWKEEAYEYKDPATPPGHGRQSERGDAGGEGGEGGEGGGDSSGQQTQNDGADSSSSAPTKEYCTQACLLGLKSGCGELDDKCPNVAFHRVAGSARHAINATQFTDLMGEQLRQDAYQGCDALISQRKFGATGVLFKLELVEFGYTFVGKGTIPKCLGHLEHESSIYQRLVELQGEVVPVHLGMVSLASGYLLPGGARVMHMMMMSWGGELAAKATLPDLESETQRSMRTIFSHGVYHNDEREPNLLWNSERGRVMVIDFDCSKLLPPPKRRKKQKGRDGRNGKRVG